MRTAEGKGPLRSYEAARASMMAMDLKYTYNKIAEDWHNDHVHDTWWISGTERFASFVGGKKEVLDIGCGGGVKSKFFKEKGFVVTGIDFSEKMIEIARREYPEIQFSVLDMRDVEKLEGMYDGIFIQAALLHIPHQEAADVVRKISTKLRTGGYLYIAVKERYPGRVAEEIKVEDDYGYSYERFFSYYSVGDLEGYFKDSGFEIVYEETTGEEKKKWIQMIGKKM